MRRLQFSEVAGKVLRQQEDHSVLVQFADKKVRVHPGCLEFHVPGKRKCKPTGAVHADKLKGSSRDTCADHAGSAKGMKYGDRGHGGASAQSIGVSVNTRSILYLVCSQFAKEQ